MSERLDPADYLRTLSRAETASATEAWPEAARHWSRVVAANPVEGRFWARLGEARRRTGDHSGAISAYEHALDLRSGLPAETAYKISACWLAAGDRQKALDWLRRAADLGLRELLKAATDDDFAALRDDPRFAELTGAADPEGRSRDEGWRADLDLLTREVRRLGYDPFRELPEADFDAAWTDLRERIPSLTDGEILVGITRLLAMLGDGHAYVYPGDDRPDLRRSLPLRLWHFEEGLFVVGADAADPSATALLGAQILAFEGTGTDAALAAVAPLVSSDHRNEFWIRYIGGTRYLADLVYLHALGLAKSAEQVTLSVRDAAGEARDVTIGADPEEAGPRWRRLAAETWPTYAATLPTPVPLSMKNADISYWYEYLPADRTVYFQLNRVRSEDAEPLSEFTERLLALVDGHVVDKLVIDLRHNGGGNTFLEMPLLYGLIGHKRINRRGRLFVIVGRRTYSAAQNFATMLERHTNAILVGEPTGSGPQFIGETIPFQLPYSKLTANVSDLFWQPGWPTDYRRFVAPTLYTPSTFADYRANRDPALEAILAWQEHLPGL